MKLNGKIALVTGGATGIGLATAKSLAGAGASVILAARNEARLTQAAAGLPGARYVTMDVSSPESVAEAFAEAGPVDIIVNNAGSATTAPFGRTSNDQWQQMLDVNLTGTFLCTQAALPAMKERGWGRIINIASTAAQKGYAYTAAYCAAKHGVLGMTRALALELAGSAITANCVCPGFTDTQIVADAINNIVARTGRTKEEALADLVRSNPQGRLIQPEEVAETVLWLCSDGARSVTGQAISVAGGEVM